MHHRGQRFIRIRRRQKRQLISHGKKVYKYHQLELTIPSRFKHIVEPFMNKDLEIEAKRVGDKLVIEAEPVENTM